MKLPLTMLFVAACATAAAAEEETEPEFWKECPNNLVWRSCIDCEISCDGSFCAKYEEGKCPSGCGCPPGKVLDKGNLRCIDSKDQCDSNSSCKPGFEWQTCKTCFKDCADGGPTKCFMGCKVGCQCPEGKYYDEKNEKCVDKIQQCYKKTQDPSCPGELTYQECASACKTCLHNEGDMCILACKTGCACPPEKPWKHPFRNKCFANKPKRACQRFVRKQRQANLDVLGEN